MMQYQSPGDKRRGKLLAFTCPECGWHWLEQVVYMRQWIQAVYDPTDPDYDWYYDTNKQMRKGDPHYSTMDEANAYRCGHCEAELRDEDGNVKWGGDFLLEWLKAHSDPHPDDSTTPDQAAG